MSTDRTPPHGPQEASSVHNLTEALFGPHLPLCWIAESGHWEGGYYRRATLAAFSPDSRHHFCCALIKPEKPGDGIEFKSSTRSKANFAGAILFVLDDVGVVAPPGASSITGSRVSSDVIMFGPEPGWIVETSKGNFQIGWRIEVETNLARWERFLGRMKKHPMFGAGVHDDAVHYFRMETGKGKPEKGAFQTRLAQPFTGKIWKLDELASAFGIDMAIIPAAAAKPATAGETLSPDAVGRLLDLLPDSYADDYDAWIRVGHAVYGATGGSPEGYDRFEKWSRKSDKFDVKRLTADVWDTFASAKASATTLRVIIEDEFGPDSKERKAAGQIFAAGGVFEAIEEEPGMSPKAEAKADRKFRELLKEIAKTQPVPDHHKPNGKGHDEHWFPTGGGLLDIGALVSGALPVAPPVIYEPFVRGVLTVVGGAPSIGKSNLMLDQCLAVVAGRGDLLRNGCKLQFAGDVIFVSNEDGLSVLQRRAIAWATYHKVDLTKTPFKLIPVRTSLFSKDAKETWHADCTPLLERILEHGRTGRRVAMLVVDTLATSVIGVNENQTVDISPAMKLFSELGVALWCSVPFLHHTTKEAWARGSADTTLRSIATIRGSGGITGTYTRGATLIVAPNKKELDEHPDWAGRDIVVEFMAKANDGPENYVAGYYERVLVDVQQVSATDPAVLEFRREPVLVPFQPMIFGTDTVLLDGYEAALRAHNGEVRVVEKIGPNGSPNAVQTILGVTNSSAKTVVEGLIGTKRAKIVAKKDKRGRDYSVLEFPSLHHSKTE